MRRSFLCSRCGGVVEALDLQPGETGDGACPDCGLGFTSSASVFSGPRPGPAGWRARRRGRQSLEAHQTRQDHVLRRRTFPVFGLDDRWTGPRWTAGWSSSDDVVESIGLGYGDPYDPGSPEVRVFTARLAPPRERMTEVNATQELVQYLWHEGGADHDIVRSAYTDQDPTAAWSDVTLPVDGQPTAFRTLASGSFWVALGRVGEGLVTIQARLVDPAGVGLVTVHDVEPYLGAGPSPH
ncbi:MAG: hypothetical protein ACRDZ7_04700 [Acidimicrobiia bacterium]